MRRPIVPAAAALLTAGALRRWRTRRRPRSSSRRSDPSAPADDTADPADAPDAGEPADPADDNADPDEAAMASPPPTPAATPTRRKDARRKVARAPTRASRGPLHPSGLSTRGPDRSARYATTWPALSALNRVRIADPDVMYPGQVLRT